MNSTDVGDIVVDFFGGSGATLMAAEMTGRACYTAELDPQYVDAIIKRYIEANGTATITVERDGVRHTFEDIVRSIGEGI